MYSNELEKENTALFALGFSFADEHIQEITLRSANSNPTLGVFIVAYQEAPPTNSAPYSRGCRHSHIFIIQPPMEAKEGEAPTPQYLHTIDSITEHIFRKVAPESRPAESKLGILHEPQYCR